MKTRYSISIPKPCHENWLDMSPNEKGRFCQSCSKTVVDFTKMKTHDVQEFIHNNKGQRICGHIKQSQLDMINLQISESVFEQTMSFHKLFLLALLFAMGTSLLSCQDEKGNVKKIESVEIVEKSVDSLDMKFQKQIDSTITCTSKEKTHKSINKKKDETKTIVSPVLDGLIILTGDIEETLNEPIHTDSIQDIQLEELEGEIAIHDEVIIGLITVEEPPMFPGTSIGLSIQEKKELFKEKIANFVNDNFLLSPQICLDLSGRHKVFVQFTIDENGYLKGIKARGPNLLLEKEAVRVIELLPQFIPAIHEGRPIEMIYSLPIIFEVKD